MDKAEREGKGRKKKARNNISRAEDAKEWSI